MVELKIYSKTIDNVMVNPTLLYEEYVQKDLGFLLESYNNGEGRYSFIGKNPEEKITATDNALIIDDLKGHTKELKGNPLEQLKNYMSKYTLKNTIGLPFEGGLVGALGYDFIRYIEDLPNHNTDEIGIDPIQLLVVRQFIAIDHMTKELTLVVLEEQTDIGRTKAMNQLETMALEIKSYLDNKNPIHFKGYIQSDGEIINHSDTRETFCEKVKKAKDYIIEGDIFQVVLSQRWTIKSEKEGFTLFKELKELNPSPYLYYFNFLDYEIIGSSPEMLVKKTGNKIFTCPIAGTRKRGQTKEEDEALKKELLADEKERAEHVMLVDLARNDMGKIAEFNSVNVIQFMEVHNYSHVMHIVSLVEGISKDAHPLDILGSFLPAGTLSGAPKIRAMEIIDELESVQRGLYGGAIGYFGFNGNMDMCITIRTMIKKEDHVYLQAGAGIVADSVPDTEYEECGHKAKALAKILIKEVDDLDTTHR
ncbi:anthranilate synthase component 1 [Natranaerovirga hydrolytica]|uniref:Anthranilate synthase component 1 n=1 Tax=Natranaerovirga hydrolytica TaxID=680378 RepID=A0A4R1MY75_9FIRM|nr:anthranilate synthase component I [Natranaerovirga hydrolytica]TCK98227.1 anthranilate synthase component 1 [Natranaerovirga hydrolytica]